MLNQGKFEEGLEKCNEAIKEAGEKVEALYYANRAVAYVELDQPDLADADCRAALKLDEKCFHAYWSLSKIQAYKGKLQAAIEPLQ